MHDTETGRGYNLPTDSSTDTENCPHACLERVGRVRNGVTVVDLDCVDCPATVHEDVSGRTVDRGRGVATDGGTDIDSNSIHPEDRLSEAAKQVRIVRQESAATEGEHTALSNIETRIRGAAAMLECWRDEQHEDDDTDLVTDGGHTIVGDPSDSAESPPVEISDCEVGDDVVIEPEPSVETDAPEEIRGEVTRAEESTHKMAGDSRERVVGETLEVNADDGETYVRKGTGTVFVIQERRTRAGVQDFHCAIAFDSSLRLAGGEDDA